MEEKVKIVICGCGQRSNGTSHAIIETGLYEIVGVCDPYADKAHNRADIIKEKTGRRPLVYTDHIEMFEELKPQACLVVANWEVHVSIAIDAMRRGIAVAMEVGGAYDEEECWELVKVYEETKTPFMFMENCCFNKEELLVTNLVRHGVLGEISFCSASYGHDIRREIGYGDKTRHYRLRNYLERNADNYPTHDLGPIAKMLNINRGNRMVSLISRSSKGVGMRDYIKTQPELKYLEEKTFAQGDIIKTLITCENGELIELTLDTTLPRYYSRELTVRGTQGFYSMDNNSVFLNSDIVSQGETLDRANIKDLFKNSEKKYYKYLPSDWKNVTEEIIQAGHGGMDYFEFKAFADCLLSGKEMPIDVYDAVAWMCITYLSERSLKTGMAQEIPDFTNGKYKARLPKDVMDFPRIEE